MEVRVADEAGFCFGVQRAVDTVYKQIETGRPIYTFGPIVHNEEVVRELCEKGVKVIEDEKELEAVCPEKNAVVIVRAHGVTKAMMDKLEDKGFEVIDATCPFVNKIHNIVMQKENEGHKLIIAGDPDHPEVIGIRGWLKNDSIVLKTVEEADSFAPEEGAIYTLVAQTTFQVKKFQEIVDIFRKRGYNVNVVNTICNATEVRQRSAAELSEEADAMIVIGSRSSSNTRKLYEICKANCDNTYFIQTLDDLNLDLPKSLVLVGITAGASTPQKIIEEVQNNVRGTYF